jgi:hypothetical protein
MNAFVDDLSGVETSAVVDPAGVEAMGQESAVSMG